MSQDFGRTTYPTARKRYACAICSGPIPTGEKHAKFNGVCEGEWQNWRAHRECYENYMADSPGEEICGDAPIPDSVLARLKAAGVIE